MRAEVEGAKVLWMGHSLGASIATVLLSQQPPGTRCEGLIFENGFASIPEMVRVLYPSKWLPYHYLGCMALDTWDARGVFEKAAREGRGAGKLVRDVPILFVASDDDELVPPAMMRELYRAALKSRGGEDGKDDKGVRWVEVKGGLHDFGWKKEVWGKSVVQFVRDVVHRTEKR
jgi:pimeloyl-ACP methyl ester carboxylesterase